MDKVVKDGKVAVLISTGYGAGWSSLNGDYPECLFDPDIVAIMESDADIGLKKAAAKEVAEKKWPNGYWGGVDGLRVEWVEEGTQIRIEEYDGFESLNEFGSGDWVKA